MKRIINYEVLHRILVGFCFPAVMAFFLTACEKDLAGSDYRVYDDKMIDEILLEEGLTDFFSIAEIAGYYGTIHAYGTNTMFAPTNEAVSQYLHDIGKNSINDLSEKEAEDIIKYHLVLDTLATTAFIDGRMTSPNFAKKYLTTKEEADGDLIYQRINRQANIIKGNLRGANGYLHIIDNMLTPPEKSITDVVRELPDDYSFMKSLFEESGWADSLAVEREDNWYTFFLQSNAAFEKAGINNKDELLDLLAESTPLIARDSLIHNFIGYHASNRRLYILDLLSSSSFSTLIPRQIVTVKRNQDQILLNEFIQDKLNEPGIPVIRNSDEYTDLNCSNGVIQTIDGNIEIKNRSAYRIYWDLAEQPEIMALKNYRQAGTRVQFSRGDLADINWGGKSMLPELFYYCGGVPSTAIDEKFQAVYGDHLEYSFHTSTNAWIEYTTPVLIEGKYKIWLCYRRMSETTMKTIFKQEGYDDQVLPYLFDLSGYLPNPDGSGTTPGQVEQQGWKRYNAKKYNSVICSRLLGIIDVQQTGRHVLRFEAQPGGRASTIAPYDMVQFIPIDEDQLWPRIDMKGDWYYEGYRECEAWPENCPIEEEEPEVPAEGGAE